MAQYPCDRCGSRYLGPGNRAYVSILDGEAKWQYKPRLCPRDVQELREIFDEVDGWIDPTDTTPYKPQPCLVCAQSVVGRRSHSVFITLFTGRDARSDGYAPLCADHREQGEALLESGFRSG